MASKGKQPANNNISEPKISVLSITDMSYLPSQEENTFHISKKIINKKPKDIDANLTLIAAITNALINKDNDSFLWCLDQKDVSLVDATVKKMEKSSVKMFLEKMIDLFQSSSLSKKNTLPWLKAIFENHKYGILSMDKEMFENLAKIRNLIKNYTKYKSNLILLSERMKKINKVTDNKKEGIDEPLLTYYESDEEDNISKKMKEKGFEEVSSENESEDNAEEDEELPDEEDFLDDDDEESDEEKEINLKEKNDEDDEMSEDDE